MENLLEQIAYCVERGKVNANSPFPPELKGQPGADELTKSALDLGISPSEILNDSLILGMQRVGEKFKMNKVFVPEVLISAKAMKAAMNHLNPYFLSKQIKPKGKVIIGTVAGDLHDIGKNIVGMILQGGGWEVIDLGIDVSADKFFKAVNEHSPNFVCLSALLTTTMLNMEKIINEIKPTYPEIKIIIGGAPVNQGFADLIKADHYSPDPQDVLEYLNNSIDENRN